MYVDEVDLRKNSVDVWQRILCAIQDFEFIALPSTFNSVGAGMFELAMTSSSVLITYDRTGAD